MRITLLATSAVLLLLTGCTDQRSRAFPNPDSSATSVDSIGISDSERGINITGNVDRVPLSNAAKSNLPAFLAAVDLIELLPAIESGDTPMLTKSLCEMVYSKFNETRSPARLSDEECSTNLKKDGQTIAIPDVPLIIAIRELGDDYLLLLVEEEGLEGVPLFTYVYHVGTGGVRSIDRTELSRRGASSIYYSGSTLVFYSRNGSCRPETDVCDQQREATYDIVTGRVTYEKSLR